MVVMLGGYGRRSMGMPEVKAARQVDQFEEGAVALLGDRWFAAALEREKNGIGNAEDFAAADARHNLL